jgi:copper chaperone CopZ
VQRSLEAVPGVSDVKVDFANKTATLKCDGSVKDEALVKAVPDRFTVKVKS